jgi:hypothetical protein
MAKEKKAVIKESHSVYFGEVKAQTEKRAREIFLNRQSSNSPGDALSDWLQAEKEITSRHLLP